MPTFQGNPFSNFFKRILQINQSSNTGVDATTRNLQTGDGTNTAVSLSDDVVKIQPQSDNTTGTLVVANQSGSSIFSVDTTNSKVLVGASQYAMNTQYTYFGRSHGADGSTADTWSSLFFGSSYILLDVVGQAMGTSTTSSFGDTNPASSLTLATTAHTTLPVYWYVPDNITIDAIEWFSGAESATGDVLKAVMMAYDLDKANGSTSGDLTNGSVVASSSNVTNNGYEQIHYNSMSVSSPNVDAGKCILLCVACDTVNSDYAISATVKYHLR